MDAPQVPVSPAAVNSAAKRILMLLLFILFLQVPVLLNSLIVNERRGRRDEAVVEVAGKWGQGQSLVGPALCIPWTRHWVDVGQDGKPRAHDDPQRLVVLPESLSVRGRIVTETRQRGIYKVPVYRLSAVLSGRFARPDLSKLAVDSTTLDWRRATLGIGVSDPRAIEEQVSLDWNGRRLEFMPGPGDFVEATSGIHAELEQAGAGWNSSFTIPLRIRGTRSVSFAPFGKTTRAELTGSWPSPSFQGLWLPAERTVADSGFSARWQIPDLGRNFGQAWTDAMGPQDKIKESCFGLDLFSDIDAYRMCERTSKYAALFFILTFTAFWLLELLGGRAIHPIQYAMIGAALCMFLLLELALAEHIGFGLSYLLASAAVVALIVHYASAALGSGRRSLLVGAGLALLYLFHYFVLRNEDYALLLGSLLLFGTLVAVMLVTRRFNWYGTRS